MHPRPIKDILKDADLATNIKEIYSLWEEILSNNKKYTLQDIGTANEHIRELIMLLDIDETAKERYCIILKSQKPLK